MDFISKNTVKGEVKGVKIDFITHAYPLVNPPVIFEDIRMAGIEDIAAMKLNAIIGNGTRLKDFIDIAYSSSLISLNQMLSGFEKKYEVHNPVMAIKALSYFNDINQSEPIYLLNGKPKWPRIEDRIMKMIASPSKIFPTLSMAVKQERKHKPRL